MAEVRGEEIRKLVRTRLEEVRTRIMGRIEEIRARIRGSSSEGFNPELPTLKEIREKGLIGVLEERFPRIKEIREKGILAPKETVGEERRAEEVAKREKITPRYGKVKLE